jgi:DNA transformation protein
VPCSLSFLDHALDLVCGLGQVQARRLFGGYGLYAQGVMFGLLSDDELFLKTDRETLERFTSAGCRMWTYGEQKPDTHYFRPPDEAHEDAESMQPWAELGLGAALRARAARVRAQEAWRQRAEVAKVAGRAHRAKPARGPTLRPRSR